MSNLGAYQMITTLAKKVGGPIVLAAITFVGGYLVIRGAEGGIKKIIKKKKAKDNVEDKYKGKIFDVIVDGKERGSPEFHVGDKFRIFTIDDDSVLVEKHGDNNNPYFVSRGFLQTITGINI